MGKLIGELVWRLWMCEVEEFTDTAVLSIHSIQKKVKYLGSCTDARGNQSFQ